MKKSWIVFIVLIIALPIAYYLLSPIFSVVEVEEVSPLAQAGITQAESPIVKDAMDAMDEDTKKIFNEQVEAMKDQIIVMEDKMPEQPQLLAEGEFEPRAHEVEGKALLIDTGDKKILRFEDFDTINGPALYIYLSSELGDEDFIDLGKIKATKGNVNYELPDDVDITKYNKVLVWCRTFSVLFSYAEIA